MQPWIGLAHVKPREHNHVLGASRGAFVPVLGLSSNQERFCMMVVTALNSMAFDVVELSDIELWQVRKQRCVVDRHIHELIASLTAESPTAFGHFKHTRAKHSPVDESAIDL